MNMLYDSESFAVVHLLAAPAEGGGATEGKPTLVRHGFEIVDKRSGKEIYLDGSWAEGPPCGPGATAGPASPP